MKIFLLVVWCAYFVPSPTVKGFFSYCDRNETLFVPEGSSATFNAEGIQVTTYLYILLTKYNKTMHALFYIEFECCDFLNISEVTFIDPWIKNRTKVTGNSTNIAITLRGIEKADNGTYLVRSRDYYCFALFVIGINKQPDESIEEHNPAYFYAYPKASAIRRPIINATMMWLVDGKNITQSPMFVLQDGMIWLASVSRNLNGRNVTYRAVQDGGTVTEANYTIEVTYGPVTHLDFSPDRDHYFLTSGQVMPDVSCSVDCRPPCRVSWDTHSKGDTLSLSKVSTAMTGTYTCTATRPGTDTTVKRRLLVQVKDENAWQLQLLPERSTYFLNAGDTLPDITCKANCNPPCEVSWGMDSKSERLSLGKLSSEMSGEYVCRAQRNDTNRTAVAKITVFVQYTSGFTIAIAVLGSIQAVTTTILCFCGIAVYRRNNALPCQSGSKTSKSCMNSDRKTLSGHENNRNDIKETDLEHYEDLDSGRRNDQQNYDYVQTPGKTAENSMELYENTQTA